MALIAHGERAVRLVLPDARVGAERGGDRHVPGELGQQPGVDAPGRRAPRGSGPSSR